MFLILFLLILLLLLILHVTFYILKFAGKSLRLLWIRIRGLSIIWDNDSYIEQWRVEIGSYNGCSLHSIVKLHLNLFNLLFSISPVSFCIIVITVSYITKFQVFLYLSTLLLYDFLIFLSISISYSNFSHFCEFIFVKRCFTNYW